MNRVRTGLTGLGIVFLLTLVASVAFAPSQDLQSVKAPGEPLAQLGVAPSNDKTMDGNLTDGRATPGNGKGAAGEVPPPGANPAANPPVPNSLAPNSPPPNPQVAGQPTVAVPDAALSALERSEPEPSI